MQRWPTVDVVLAVCTLNCTFFPSLQREMAASFLRLRNMWVYNKCGQRTECSSFATREGAHPNVGRCDYTFASHIATHYTTLADFTVFGKDGLRARQPERDLRRMVREVRSRGVGCVMHVEGGRGGGRC